MTFVKLKMIYLTGILYRCRIIVLMYIRNFEKSFKASPSPPHPIFVGDIPGKPGESWGSPGTQGTLGNPGEPHALRCIPVPKPSGALRCQSRRVRSSARAKRCVAVPEPRERCGARAKGCQADQNLSLQKLSLGALFGCLDALFCHYVLDLCFNRS